MTFANNQDKSDLEDLLYKNNNNKLNLIVLKLIHFKCCFLAIIILAYTFSSYLQREHLFVWSVFAPKLIYQLGYFTCELILIHFALFLSKIFSSYF